MNLDEKEFCAKLQKHIKSNQLHDAVDLVYDTFDELLLAQKFDETKSLIFEVMKYEWPLSILLSVLTITIPCGTRLDPARSALVAFTRFCAYTLGGQSKADSVMRGLE